MRDKGNGSVSRQYKWAKRLRNTGSKSLDKSSRQSHRNETDTGKDQCWLSKNLCLGRLQPEPLLCYGYPTFQNLWATGTRGLMMTSISNLFIEWCSSSRGCTLSVVWRWVASISTGQVPFFIFRGPLAMLFSGWVLMLFCRLKGSSSIYTGHSS